MAEEDGQTTHSQSAFSSTEVLLQENSFLDYDREDFAILISDLKKKRDENLLECKILKRYAHKMDISLEVVQEKAEQQKFVQQKGRKKFRGIERKVRFTTDQRMIIYKSEIEELKNDIERLVKGSSKISATYAAILEEAGKRLKEIKKFWYEFDRDVVKVGYSDRFKAILSDFFIKYMQNYIRQRDTLQDKLLLGNVALRAKINKMKFQLQQKEESGEVLHEVDFEQLKIENAQYLARIDEKNQELLQLKLQSAKFAFNLNRDKTKLREVLSENVKLIADIEQYRDLISLMDAETARVQQSIDQEKEKNAKLKNKLADYKAPSVRDYIHLIANLNTSNKKCDKLKRQLILAQNGHRQQQALWNQLKKTASS